MLSMENLEEREFVLVFAFTDFLVICEPVLMKCYIIEILCLYLLIPIDSIKASLPDCLFLFSSNC